MRTGEFLESVRDMSDVSFVEFSIARSDFLIRNSYKPPPSGFPHSPEQIQIPSTLKTFNSAESTTNC